MQALSPQPYDVDLTLSHEETEARRGSVACPRSLCSEVAELQKPNSGLASTLHSTCFLDGAALQRCPSCYTKELASAHSFIALRLGDSAGLGPLTKREDGPFRQNQACGCLGLWAQSQLLLGSRDRHRRPTSPSVSFTSYLFHSSISSLVNRSRDKMFSIIAGYFYPFIRVISFGK